MDYVACKSFIEQQLLVIKAQFSVNPRIVRGSGFSVNEAIDAVDKLNIIKRKYMEEIFNQQAIRHVCMALQREFHEKSEISPERLAETLNGAERDADSRVPIDPVLASFKSEAELDNLSNESLLHLAESLLKAPLPLAKRSALLKALSELRNHYDQLRTYQKINKMTVPLRGDFPDSSKIEAAISDIGDFIDETSPDDLKNDDKTDFLLAGKFVV